MELLVKSELAKVTILLETEVALLPIPGQAVPSEGMPEVEVVQLEIVVLMVKSEGKRTRTFASVPAPAEEGLAQTNPESAVFALVLSSLR